MGFGAGGGADTGWRLGFFATGRLTAARAATRATRFLAGRAARRVLAALAARVRLALARLADPVFERALGRAAARRAGDFRFVRAGFDRERRVERRAAFLAAMTCPSSLVDPESLNIG
jgi:hypothetical protein